MQNKTDVTDTAKESTIELSASSTPVWKLKMNSVLPDLGAAERRVATYVAENPDSVVGQSVTEVANASGVSDATVVRFARRLGYAGYQGLKIAVAREQVPVWQNVEDDVSPQDDISAIKKKVFSHSIQALRDSYALVDDEGLKQAADAISQAKRIDVYGVGGSGCIAADAVHKFMKLGIRASVHVDSNLQVMSASHLTPGDVAIGISYSGGVRDVVEALEVAHRRGATTICITHLGISPIVEVSDVCLYTTAIDAKHRSDAGAARLAQLAIIDTLFVSLALSGGDDAAEAYRRMMEEMSIKGY